MNLVGKIFVMLILFMSITFMVCAMLVYVTHKNWQQVVNDPQNGLNKQLADAKAQLADMQSQRARLETDIANEQTTRARVVAELTEKLTLLQQANNELIAAEAAQVEAARTLTLAMAGIQDTLAKLRDNVDTLQTALDTARKERDEALANSLVLEDKKAVAEGELARLNQRVTLLAADVARYQLLFQDLRVQLDPTPRVEGFITAVNDNGLVEISIGFDDGIQAGDTLEVFRREPEPRFLGRIEIVSTEADVAVGRIVDNPALRKGTIQVNDEVATRLEQVARPNAVEANGAQ